MQSLKLHLIMKTLLFALILSRYWQIGVFALVIEASCGPGRVLSILSASPSTLHKSIFLSALNMFQASCKLKGKNIRSKLMQKLRSWSEYLDGDSNATRSAVDFLLPQGK